MIKEKISDFIDIWANTIGLRDITYINIIKSDIYKRYIMYKDVAPYISVNQDSCDAYIIKPIDGKYSLEDFLLNRLMLGLREIDISGALEGNSGEYTADYKSLDISIEVINKYVDDKSKRHIGLKGKNSKIVTKTFEHELGHCVKSRYTNGCSAPLGGGRGQDEIYRNLVRNILSYKNGKYANMIKNVSELNFEETSKKIKTGIGDSKKRYEYDYRFSFLDELLNESESLLLTNSNEVHEIGYLVDDNNRISGSRNYVNIYNYLSGYRSFTGYGDILRALIGKKDLFYAEYISSEEILEKFNEEYSDIAKEVFNVDTKKIPPLKCIFILCSDLIDHKKAFNEEIMLSLDLFFAKCYEKKINKQLFENDKKPGQETCNEILNEIELFQQKLTRNPDEEKMKALEHNIIFNNIKNKIRNVNIAKEDYQAEKQDEDFDLKEVDVQSIINVIDSDLIKKMVTLPNGNKIPARQYIQEYVFPLLPENGIIILKNNDIISIKQFIEKNVIVDCQEQYNGDILRYMVEETKKNPGVICVRDGDDEKVIRSIDIAKEINPVILNRMITLPNGNKIPARQYIQEMFAPHIPLDGQMILKNRIDIPVKQYIEEILLSEDQAKYNGDISQILYNTTINNSGKINLNPGDIKKNLEKLKNSLEMPSQKNY